MSKLCLRERAENGEDGMAKFALEDPAAHLTSVSFVILMMILAMLVIIIS